MPTQLAAYRRAPTEGNPRSTEGWALLEAARKMREAQSGSSEAILSAMRLNWKLWTIFQSSLTEPDCPVPTEIRINLLSLSNFIDRRSAEIIANPDPEKLTTLININLQIGSGLLTPPAPIAAPAAPVPQPAAPSARSIRQEA